MLRRLILLSAFRTYDVRYFIGVKFVSPLLIGVFFFLRFFDTRAAISLLLAAHRANYSTIAQRLIKNNLELIGSVDSSDERPSSEELKLLLGRSIIVKNPTSDGGLREKGILIIKFTETFIYFLKHIDCSRLLADYHVVLEPSWTGQALEEVLGWTQFELPVYVQTAGAEDYRFIESLGSNLVPIRTGAGDYVDSRVFRPLGLQKEFGCLCIGNYCDHKRLHSYLLAVRKIVRSSPSFKAALVCASMGQRRRQLLELIEELGLSDSVHFVAGCSQSRLNEVMNRSKVTVFTSYREGASKVISESLFADVPVIILEENVGVNRNHINDLTGLVVPEKNLSDAILLIGRSQERFSPRAWALDNISPDVTLAKVSGVICKEERGGRPFRAPLMKKVNCPEARYWNDSDNVLWDRSRRAIERYVRDSQLEASVDGVSESEPSVSG